MNILVACADDECSQAGEMAEQSLVEWRGVNTKYQAAVHFYQGGF